MPVPLTPQEVERWNRVLAAAAKLQSVIPEAFLVGGTAVGIYAPYRTSRDADHTMSDLPRRCTKVLARLEALSGWSTDIVRGQHTILGRMDGIEVTLMVGWARQTTCPIGRANLSPARLDLAFAYAF